MPEQDNKRIFSYFDGFENVFADPAEIDYRFTKASEMEDMDTINKWFDSDEISGGSPDDDPKVAEQRRMKIALFMEACHRLDPIIRKAFEVKPFDKKTGIGMLHEEVMNLYLTYMEWKYDLKKNTD